MFAGNIILLSNAVMNNFLTKEGVICKDAGSESCLMIRKIKRNDLTPTSDLCSSYCRPRSLKVKFACDVLVWQLQVTNPLEGQNG